LIIESFVISMLVGLIRRGSLRNLAQIPLRHTFLFVLPFLLFGCLVFLMRKTSGTEFAFSVRIGNVIQYLILLAAIALNLHIPEMRIIGAGTFLNALALTVNGGMMPVSMAALKVAGIANAICGETVRHIPMTPNTRLNFLTDVVPVYLGNPYLSAVVSIGDVVIAIGVFILIQRYLCRPAVAAKETAACA
jgi:hypothetical protein